MGKKAKADREGKKAKSGGKARCCGSCSSFRDGECWNEGPMLFVAMTFRYAGLGYGREDAGHKSFLRPVVEKKHTGCKHWIKKT